MQAGPAPHTDYWIVLLVANSLTQATVVSGLLGVVVRWHVLVRRRRPERIKYGLDAMMSAFFTAAAFPFGLFLIVCAFDPHLIMYLNELHLALAAAGIASLYVAYTGLFG